MERFNQINEMTFACAVQTCGKSELGEGFIFIKLL